MRLFTSRYQAADRIIASGATAVGITRYPPRWALTYPCIRFTLIAPSAGLLRASRSMPADHFDTRYLAEMEAIGFDAIRAQLEAISGGNDLVLLCFENVEQGEACHRRTFAEFWQRQTGHEMPEL